MRWHNLFSCHTHKWSSFLVQTYYQYHSCGLTIYCRLYPHRLFPLRSFSIAVFFQIDLRYCFTIVKILMKKCFSDLNILGFFFLQHFLSQISNKSPISKFSFQEGRFGTKVQHSLVSLVFVFGLIGPVSVYLACFFWKGPKEGKKLVTHTGIVYPL